MSSPRRILLCGALCVGLVGCAKKNPEPQLASSASSPTYATEFPEQLAATKTRFNDREADVQDTVQRMSDYPGQLENPNWELVSEVVQLADTEGRSHAYVERLEEVRAVARFFKAEGEEVERKVAGSVQYTAKKKNCDAELGGSARFALRKALVERLEARLRARSDAHALIEEHEAELGPQNVKRLQEQADAISRAAYAAHVGMTRARLELDAMVEQLQDVKKTLDRRAKELSDRSSASNLEDAERKFIDAKLERIRAARARLDAELVTTRDLQKNAEERVARAQEAYDAARNELQKKIATEAAAADPTASWRLPKASSCDGQAV